MYDSAMYYPDMSYNWATRTAPDPDYAPPVMDRHVHDYKAISDIWYPGKILGGITGQATSAISDIWKPGQIINEITKLLVIALLGFFGMVFAVIIILVTIFLLFGIFKKKD